MITSSSVAEVQQTGDDNNSGFFDPSLGYIDYTYGPRQRIINFNGSKINDNTIKLDNYKVGDGDIGNCARVVDDWYTITSVNVENNSWILAGQINTRNVIVGCCGGALKTVEKVINIVNKYNVKPKIYVKGYDINGYETFRIHRLGLAPTLAQIATAIWSDLLTGGDFDTTGSIGILLASSIDTNINSRLAATAVPSNFSFLSIDSSGGVTLQPTGLDQITAWGGVTVREAIFYAAAGCVGRISGLPASPATIFGLDGVTTAAVVSFDSNGNRTGVTLNPP